MQADPPEERLLRLIKGTGKKSDDTKEAAAPSNSQVPRFISDLILKNRILKGSFLPFANRVLAVMLAALMGYFIYSLAFKKYEEPYELNQEAPTNGEARPRAGEDLSAPQPAAPEDYSKYSQEMAGKQIFGSGEVREPTPGARSSLDADISKRFNLVGIISGEEPQAIIEDAQLQKTYYISKGQSMGGITVTEISDGRVALSYEGNEAVLVL